MYDYYKILEIPRDAGLEDIKHAYRLKAKLVHPDVNNSPRANEVFVIVNEAHEVLTDENKRYLYDVKLNFIDAAKVDADRKKHYYGSSVKNDSYNNLHATYFNYDWESFNAAYKEKTDEAYYRRSPFIYNLFFASGMLIGFMIVTIALVGTNNHYWPFPFLLLCVPGFILIRGGWKGMIGKKTLVTALLKHFRS
jgi:curved DNA-binding protein CbpA